MTGRPPDAGDLYADLAGEHPEELITPLVDTGGVRIERMVSRGQRSPDGFWYDQDRDEWVVLLQGAARLQFEGEPGERSLKPGQWLLLPAHYRHRVTWTDPESDSIWLAVHLDKPCDG